jgi:hypothetical protein
MRRRTVLRTVGVGVVAAAVAVLCVSAGEAAARPSRGGIAAECGQRVTVIGARGSGDPQNGDVATDRHGNTVRGMGKPGAAFAVALANRLPPGQATFLPVIYPAVGLLGNWRKIINLVGAGARIGFLGAYTGSVNDGKRILRQQISDEERLCPKVKLVLVGYSQGAQIVADIYSRNLTATQRSRVIGVVAFGDPYFNPNDTANDEGSYDPTRHGGLGTRAPYPANPDGRVFSICHIHDPICQGPGRVDFNQHKNYQNDPWVKTAAAKIARKLNAPKTPSRVHVLDFSPSCGSAATGCLREMPDSWLPDRNPRGGLGVLFESLVWDAWGSARTTASGRARICSGTAGSSDCDTELVRFTLYDVGQHSAPTGLIYRCMRFTQGPPELVNQPIRIDASLSLNDVRC